MEPANKIISILGGVPAVASIAGVHRTRVYSWMRPKKAGGTGGIIPFRHIVALLVAAMDKGVRLSAEDFLPVTAPLSGGAIGASKSLSKLTSETIPPNHPEVSESSPEISAFCSEVSEPSPKHAEGDS